MGTQRIRILGRHLGRKEKKSLEIGMSLIGRQTEDKRAMTKVR